MEQAMQQQHRPCSPNIVSWQRTKALTRCSNIDGVHLE